MQRYRLLAILGFLLAFRFAVSGSPALAATPSFTIAATNVTMSSSNSSGVGSSSFTLTSVNGYTGSVLVGCQPPMPPAGVKVPYCDVPLPPHTYTLAANQVVTGNLSLFNSPVPVVPASAQRRGGLGPAQGLALAGALLLGFGFRRRRARWLTLTLLAMGALAGLAGISACGGNNNVVTPRDLCLHNHSDGRQHVCVRDHVG